MIARLPRAAETHYQDLRGRLLQGITTFIIISGAVFWSIPTINAAENDKESRRPNVVLILADDKYEYRAHEAQNLRQNRENAVFSARYQIAGNCGEFRGIAGD